MGDMVWAIKEVVLGLISILLVILWWWIREANARVETLKSKLSELELAAAKEYATKSELTATRTEISEALLSVDRKLDRLVGLIHAKADRSEISI